MSKKTNKQAKQEKRDTRQKQEKRMMRLLASLYEVKEEFEESLFDLDDEWPMSKIETLDATTRGPAVALMASLHEMVENFENHLNNMAGSLPEPLQAELIETRMAFDPEEGGYDDIEDESEMDASPEGFLKAQSKMRDSIMAVQKMAHPALAACEAACSAAETGFLIGVGMIERTRAATEEMIEKLPDSVCSSSLKKTLMRHAEDAYIFAMDVTSASYQDTCVEAMETCKALVEGPEAIRRGATLQ